MSVKLSICSAENQTLLENLVLEQSLISCGRSQSCTVVLQHEGLSRRHFIIKYVDKQYIIIDQESRHGTILDGRILEANKSYNLDQQNKIEIPGFIINFSHDGQAPKCEKTTVLARKMLDKILTEPQHSLECPYLADEDNNYRFTFIHELSYFILGNSNNADFYIKDNLIKPQHASFTRDINGIKIITIGSADIKINGYRLTNPVILKPGDQILMGSTSLIFHEFLSDDHGHSAPKKTILLPSQPELTAGSAPLLDPKPTEHLSGPHAPPSPGASSVAPKYKIIRWGDAVFIAMFLLAIISLSFVSYKII